MKKQQQNLTENSRGFALVTVLGILSILVFVGLVFANLMLSERQIAQSQTHSVEGYYASEGAIDLAMWKIRNNTLSTDNIHGWGDLFKTGINTTKTIVDYSSAPFILPTLTSKVTIAPDPMFPSGAPGRASLESYGWAKAGAVKAQRKITVKAVQGTNVDPDPLADSPMFMGGDITVSSTTMNIKSGGLYSGDDTDIRWGSVINANQPSNNQAANVQDELCVESDSHLNISKKYCADNQCGHGGTQCTNGPGTIKQLPVVDFDSDYSTCLLNKSYKCLAKQQSPTHIYTQAQFNNLLNPFQTTTIGDPVTGGIFYVTGNVDVTAFETLVVNGLLVVDGKFMTHALSNLAINNPTGTNPTHPSGILAKDQVTFEGVLSSNISIKGLVYSLSAVNIHFVASLIEQHFSLEGGLIGNNLDMLTLLTRDDITITYNPTYVDEVLNQNESPVISFDHWEEEY